MSKFEIVCGDGDKPPPPPIQVRLASGGPSGSVVLQMKQSKGWYSILGITNEGMLIRYSVIDSLCASRGGLLAVNQLGYIKTCGET